MMAKNTYELTPEDRKALRDASMDISDIPPDQVARYRKGERHAYEIARRIHEGTLDPLSA